MLELQTIQHSNYQTFKLSAQTIKQKHVRASNYSTFKLSNKNSQTFKQLIKVYTAQLRRNVSNLTRWSRVERGTFSLNLSNCSYNLVVWARGVFRWASVYHVAMPKLARWRAQPKMEDQRKPDPEIQGIYYGLQ